MNDHRRTHDPMEGQRRAHEDIMERRRRASVLIETQKAYERMKKLVALTQRKKDIQSQIKNRERRRRNIQHHMRICDSFLNNHQNSMEKRVIAGEDYKYYRERRDETLHNIDVLKERLSEIEYQITLIK